MPPAETRTRLPRSGPCAGSEQRLDAREDLLGLGHAPDALLPLGELALGGPDELDAARARSVATFACVAGCSHMRVFIAGRDEHRPGVREHGLGEDVVGEPVRHARERVRRERRDDEQVPAPEVRIRVVARRPPRERAERLGARRTAPRRR